jgi:methionine-rich copper-binding protein CopC
VRVSPTVGAVLSTNPGSVTLVFDQPLVRGSLSVKGPSGDAAGGPSMINGARLSEPLASSLPAGTYTVRWVARSQGTARTKGSYTFRLLADAQAVPSSTVASSSSAPTSQPLASNGAPATTVASAARAAGGSGAAAGAGAEPSATTRGLASAEPTPERSAAVGGSGVSGGQATPKATAVSAPVTLDPAGVSAATQPVSRTDATQRAVSSLVSGSRAMSMWLIGIAVLLQVGAGLWGLWRWRRSSGVTREGEASDGAVDRVNGTTARAREFVTSRVRLDRPWTGELPARPGERGKSIGRGASPGG